MVALAADSPTLTLEQCYEKALKQSETLAIQEQTIKIADAHYLQALSTVLPHLSGTASELFQDTAATSSGSGSFSSINNRRQTKTSLTATQTLFQGFREIYALKTSSAEKQKNILATERAKQLLFGDVARAYYAVLKIEHELAIRQSALSALQKRRKELQERINLGRSRDSELLATESETAAIHADIENDKGLVNTTRDLLGFLIGQRVTAKLVDRFTVPRKHQSPDDLNALAENRPDVGASKASTRLAKGQLDYERGAWLPNVGVTGNYYPYRTGFQNDIKWDVTFGVKVPIFDGGATWGAIKEAKAQWAQTRLTQQETIRQARLEATQAYHALIAAQSQERSLKIAEGKAKANYETLAEEYRKSLINNLEVLDGLKSWNDRKLELNEAHFMTKLRYLDLLIASGQVP